ncbi:MAG TPA: glycoside hydrolase family 127 protein [Bacteroides sp.]|nr:glycoside hydrolase family 127 protein [Bacteroides sp.]
MIKNKCQLFLIQLLVYLLVIGCNQAPVPGGEYPITPVPFTSVHIMDDFWGPRIKRNHEITIPIAFYQSEITGRIKNFEVAGGLKKGSFNSLFAFDDSDVYKIIEGASYSLQTIPDPELEAYLDSLIYKIGMAQEDDGYLYTNRTILGDNASDMAGPYRWINVEKGSHELYNVGHMYEAAVAFYEVTGKRSLLEVAIRNADLIHQEFGLQANTSAPGHQEIEIGLVKLYRTTGDEKYLNLAKFFLDVRGPGGHKQLQQHAKVIDQTEAVGHAVRATYMFSAMADIAALEKDSVYVEVIDKIWEDIVYKKTYITGGIGTHAGNEGFDQPYVLPNMEAYAETCASIGNIFLNHRLYLLHGESKYFDMLERTLYNSMLSGVSLSGDMFFYPNPLASSGQHKRSEWFGCACCPSNISRFIPAVPGYIYAKTADEIFVNLFIENQASLELKGQQIQLKQATKYPWEGKIEITINPKESMRFSLNIRRPGWVENEAIPGGLYRFTGESKVSIKLMVNDEPVDVSVKDGYMVINRKWKAGDRVTLELPMEVRKISADTRIEANLDKVSIQRGPLVYCAEWPDNENVRIHELVLNKDVPTSTLFDPELLGGTQIIKTRAGESDLTLIPYHLWNNRGPGDMAVWLSVK